MPGLDTSIVVHRLPLIDGWKLIKEKLKRMRLDILIKVKRGAEKAMRCWFPRSGQIP
jgi:hypothetical protein